MEWKFDAADAWLEGKDVHPVVAAYFEFSRLKSLYRQGWLRRGIPPERCESVAEHSFGVAVLAFLLADQFFPDLDAGRVLRIALVHDFGEIHAGDIIPSDAVPAGEKHRLEGETVASVFARLPGGGQYLALWEEYEHGATPEAQLVRQVDRLEMALQAAVYEYQEGRALQEFFDSARLAMAQPALRALFEAVEATRFTEKK